MEHVLAYLRHLCNDQKKISTRKTRKWVIDNHKKSIRSGLQRRTR